MSSRPEPGPLPSTHEVTNQSTPLENLDLFATDRALAEALTREGAGWAEAAVAEYGAALGREEVMRWGQQANAYPPELRSYDPFGHRIDEVDFHPAWHQVMRLGMAHEVHNLPWRDPRPGAFVARSAKHYLHSQIEAGSACPLTMTFASLPALRHQKDLAEEWEPRLRGTEYDPRPVPASEKSAVLIGMAMTEKQGGSDLRANSTRATPLGAGGPGASYRLVGHKWFCSAPTCDAFLTLAYTDRGLSCFLVPRWLPDGERNPIHLQRLKNKLGNRSNASAEVEYPGTWAQMVGEEGRGVRTILEMVHHTRLDCVSGTAGIMRQALAQATHHAAQRSAFGRLLREQPMMQNVLADLAIEVEAAVALLMRLARAYDESADDASARAFARIATAIAKYWVCQRAPSLVFEAMECLGGNGYVEDSILPRLYREAPVNAIWEGSGNVICLDVWRAMAREPDSVPALLEEIRLGRGAQPALDAALRDIETALAHPEDAEANARRVVERMAIALQASLLVRHAPAAVADAFCATRLEGNGGYAFGTLPEGLSLREIVDRATPAA
jgi:putative acyl-CoA dehydrogenase